MLPTSTAIMWPADVKARALELRRENPGATWPDVCASLGIDPDKASALRKACERYAASLVHASEPDGPPSEPSTAVSHPDIGKLGLTVDRDGGKIEVTWASDDGSIKTLEQLLEAVDANLDEWRVTNWKPNTWEGFAKDGDGGIVKVRLFQAKATLEPIQEVFDARAAIDRILDDLRAESPISRLIGPTAHTPERGTMLEVAIADLHVGKLAHAVEVGQDYDHNLALAAYEGAVGRLIGMASIYKPERILMPIGNDLLHVDAMIGGAQTTAKGTPQDVSARWALLFRETHRTISRMVESLAAEVAPVDIVVVPGNHDSQRTFMLGEVIDAYFTNNAAVTVSNRMDGFSVYQWNEVLLGFTHGDQIKAPDLPLTLAQRFPLEWAHTKWREVHIGHFHAKSETMERGGVRVRVIPSLCPPDAWHHSRGYASRQCAEAHVWGRDEYRATFSVGYESTIARLPEVR